MNLRQCVSLLLLSFFTLPLLADMARTPSPEGASVYIISPADGDTVPTTFTVSFGLRGMGVAPAGIDKENTGHHHLLVDGQMLPAMDKALNQDVKHFGGGQTQTELTLAPGRHTLQLILGDKGHVPHEPPVTSEVIAITVQ